MNILSYTLADPSLQLMLGTLVLAAVAFIAMAAKIHHMKSQLNVAENAALDIQADRDQYRLLYQSASSQLAIERQVNNKIEDERERLAAEVGDLKAINSQLAADLNTAQAWGVNTNQLTPDT